MTPEECYTILEVESGCSEKDLKKAYHKKALKVHPDKNNGNDTEFKKLGEAYETLTGKRKTRDMPPPPDPGFSRGFGFNMNDLFEQMRRGGFGPRPQQNRPPNTDEGIVLNLEISVDQIKSGKNLKATYKKSKDCKQCNGIGGKEKNTCVACGGAGMIQVQQQMGNAIYLMTQPCPPCQGMGYHIKDVCNACNGSGFVVYSETLDFEILEKK